MKKSIAAYTSIPQRERIEEITIPQNIKTLDYTELITNFGHFLVGLFQIDTNEFFIEIEADDEKKDYVFFKITEEELSINYYVQEYYDPILDHFTIDAFYTWDKRAIQLNYCLYFEKNYCLIKKMVVDQKKEVE